ncbi:SDR family oxidoreductase [Hymenobacter sp. H14-R3]|uniref:SDR family NAD(P)-dependent oxidoreductase n=1 Tax=Hymenobacter sp. H14-R3 TaxID=3046308 RepID=UPI0024B987F8|nr:SDR family oxidoreductase [Hymenobacter sp. H14-R3]MDJ0367815.1 SDR family oxidoreductase [Hymenobacter sp. H14-R3]
MQFQDKVAIISGGSGGIGRAVALRLAAEGARLVLVGRHADKLAPVADAARQAGAPEVWASVCDVAVEAQVAATVAGTLQRFGRLDVVVNDAGQMDFKPLRELTTDDWLRALQVDLFGAFYFIKQAFLHMKPGGSIVNISSIHAVETEALVAPYAASKAALNSLTRSAAIEGKPLGIRVNSVLPGAIDTPMLWDNPNVKSGVEKIDKADVGRPEDIADAVAYLASDRAAFVQGIEMRVDGGRLGRLA